MTFVERMTGAALIGKLRCRQVVALNARVIELIQAHPRLFKTITVDNGTEFHGYKEIERATGVIVYFCKSLLLVGAWHERKHQWVNSTVPAEADVDEAPDAGSL